MPPASSKPDYIPPSLAYLVIYNPTLVPGPSTDPDADDDDEIEQAHIVFYTARERAVSRDIMLRQVGLAKALTNFSEMFSTDGCDSVHSQRRRMIILRPEPDFWMIASVDVPQTIRPPAPASQLAKDKSRSSKKSIDKGKTKLDLPPDPVDYRENALFDDVLRKHLERGYDEFKLLHGPFQDLLDDSSRSMLEKSLEKFFTPWAWKWDVNILGKSIGSPTSTSVFDDDGPDFAGYLGLSLHPSLCLPTPPDDITTTLENIYQLSPPPAIPMVLCLNPPSTFTPPADAAATFPVSLSRYLLSVIPPPPTGRRRRASGASVATLRSPPSAVATITAASFIPPMPRINMHIGLGNMAAGVGNMTTGMGNMTAGMVAAGNPKKWSWPGYLSFGRSAAPSRDTSPTRPPPPTTREVDVKEGEVPNVETVAETPAAATEAHVAAEEAEKPPSPKEVTAEVFVDQQSLTDAIAGTPTVEETPAINLDDLQPTDDATPTAGAPDADGIAKVEHIPVQEGGDEDNSTTHPLVDEEVVAPAPPFSSTSVYINELEPAQKNKLFYLICNRLVFAFIDVDGEESDPDRLQEMSERIYRLLEELNEALEREDLRRESHLTGRQQGSDSTAAESSTPQPSSSRHISLRDGSEETTTRSVGFEPTSPHFFTANHVLNSKDSFVTEVFSRANSLKWFAAKRRDGREIYAEVGRKDASLVDVDQEVEALL